MTTRLLALALPFSLLVGCSTVSTNDPSDDDDVGGASGRYAITTHYDLSRADGMSAEASASLRALTNLSEDPAGTIVTLVEQAGGGQFLDDLPFLRDAILDGVNRFIADRKFLDQPVARKLVDMADQFATILTDFDVESELELDGSAHTLTALAFDYDGERERIESPVAANLMTAGDVEIDVSGDDLAISDHTFDLPIGELAVAAIQAGVAAEFDGDDLAGALGRLIDCDRLAVEVSNICLSTDFGPLCVGNEDNVRGLCEQGLALAADKVMEKVSEIGGASLSLNGGHAVMAGDAIESGRWKAAFDLGGAEVSLDAEFDGVLAD
jgi:hypothetical protein